MWIISWYIFIIWFFSGMLISIIGVWILASIWIPIPFNGIGVIPWVYIIWKSLSYISNILLEEFEKPIKEILIINIWFIVSFYIIYNSISFIIQWDINNWMVNIIWLICIWIFIIFKIAMYYFSLNTKK